MKRLYFLFLLAALMLCTIAHAEVWTVSPDGAADFSSLTEAVASAQAGDEIVLMTGVYDNTRETYPIQVEKRLTIRAGEGQTPVISAPRNTATMRIMADGVCVENLQVDFLGSAFWVMADDVTVAGCRFTLPDGVRRVSTCGMWIAGAKRLTMTDCAFERCSPVLVGPELTETSSSVPVLTGMFEVGEDLEFFTTHTITGCSVNGKPIAYVVGLRDTTFTADCGQLLAVDCHNVTFSGIQTPFASIGIELGWCSNVTLVDSSADDGGLFGIYLAKCDDCYMKNCRADRSTHGIDIRGVYRCVLENCTTDDCEQGIFFSCAFDCLATGCVSTGANCGFFSAAGDENHLDNSLIEGNELGLHIQGDRDFTVTNTVIRSNNNNGIRTTHTDGLHISRCEFDDNWVAVMVYYSEDVHLQDNNFHDTRNCALFLKGSKGVRQIGNRYTEADSALVQIYDTPDRLIWDDGAEPSNAGSAI